MASPSTDSTRVWDGWNAAGAEAPHPPFKHKNPILHPSPYEGEGAGGEVNGDLHVDQNVSRLRARGFLGVRDGRVHRNQLSTRDDYARESERVVRRIERGERLCKQQRQRRLRQLDGPRRARALPRASSASSRTCGNGTRRHRSGPHGAERSLRSAHRGNTCRLCGSGASRASEPCHRGSGHSANGCAATTPVRFRQTDGGHPPSERNPSWDDRQRSRYYSSERDPYGDTRRRSGHPASERGDRRADSKPADGNGTAHARPTARSARRRRVDGPFGLRTCRRERAACRDQLPPVRQHAGLWKRSRSRDRDLRGQPSCVYHDRRHDVHAGHPARASEPVDVRVRSRRRTPASTAARSRLRGRHAPRDDRPVPALLEHGRPRACRPSTEPYDSHQRHTALLERDPSRHHAAVLKPETPTVSRNLRLRRMGVSIV